MTLFSRSHRNSKGNFCYNLRVFLSVLSVLDVFLRGHKFREKESNI